MMTMRSAPSCDKGSACEGSVMMQEGRSLPVLAVAVEPAEALDQCFGDSELLLNLHQHGAALGTEASVNIDGAAAVGIRVPSNESNVLLESEKTARDGNNDKVLELLEKGADPCIRERGGRTPYAVAMDKGNLWYCCFRAGKSRFNEKSMWQTLNKVARFVHGQVLPGAVAEASFFCTAAVYATPADAVPQLLGPLMDSTLSALADTPVTGLSGDGPWAEFK
ncbi:unnamed protein product [Sphagnum compactum]